MIAKIIAFQKLMFQAIFSGSLVIRKQDLKNKKVEITILIISFIIACFMASKLFSGLFSGMIFLVITLPRLYSLLCINESIIFNLPLKRSFILLNIYIFSLFINLIFSLIVLWILALRIMIPALISVIIGNTAQLTIANFDIAFLQEFIFMILYIAIYANVIIASLFATKSKIRIANIIVFTTICSGIVLYIYSIIPKAPNQSYFNLGNSLMLIPNSWLYVTIAFCVAVMVTLGGIFMATRFDRVRGSFQN